ncbi:PPOX class F420-dependent enzyme [Mycobacterium sp.]|uniref:PPOX class F420-dependent enzyme n=1 Tax=Mycobacterium sp. TaxID=1785 RepID=UPI003F98ECE2
MELNESARNLIGKGADATLVTLNADGSPPVAVTVVSPRNSGQPISLWLSINGTARIVEGGAPELLKNLAENPCPEVDFVPEGAPPGFLTRIRVDKVGGVGPWAS